MVLGQNHQTQDLTRCKTGRETIASQCPPRVVVHVAEGMYYYMIKVAHP